MDESRDDVAVLQVVVVMGTIDVGGDHTGEHAAVLFVVGPAATETLRHACIGILCDCMYMC